MTRISLPDEQWAELHNPRKVTEKRRRPYISAMTAFNAIAPRDEKGELVSMAMGSEVAGLLDTALDLLTVALVRAWSFDLPITTDALQDLPVDAFDALRRAVNAVSHELLPNFSPTPDPKATTDGLLTPPTASSVDGSISVMS